MSEKIAYKTLREKVFSHRGDCRVDRVENELVVGMFDVNYCIAGIEGWIEIKAPTEPKRSSTPLFGSNHKLSQDQLNWCLRETKAGGNAWVLIKTDKRWLLIAGSKADVVNKLTINELIFVSEWHQIIPIKGTEPWNELLKILANSKHNHTNTN